MKKVVYSLVLCWVVLFSHVECAYSVNSEEEDIPQEFIYRQRVIQSEEFLNRGLLPPKPQPRQSWTLPKQLVHLQNIAPHFENFKRIYDRANESFDCQDPLDITPLTSRSRVTLLRLIINYKLLKLDLPETDADALFGSKNSFVLNSYWRKFNNKTIDHYKKQENKERGKRYFMGAIRQSYARENEIYDLQPTRFKVGDYVYTLRQGAFKRQRGSGKLSGLFSRNTSETYAEIIRRVNGIDQEWKKRGKKGGGYEYTDPFTLKDFPSPHAKGQAERQAIVEKLFHQRKNGGCLQIGASPRQKTQERFFNGFNLLLDFEIARRLIHAEVGGMTHKDHPEHTNLPLIYVLPEILTSYGFKNLEYFNSFFIDKKSSFSDVLSKSGLLDNEFQSPFIGDGDSRKERLKRIPLKPTRVVTSDNLKAHLREELSYMHTEEETSEEGKELLKTIA